MVYQITKEKIKRTEKDMAGYFRVWIELENGDCQILKFNKEPIITEVKIEVDRFIAGKETNKPRELEIVNEQIANLEERKKQLEVEIK